MEHPQAELLRLAADNKDQLFECDKDNLRRRYYINKVLEYPFENWRPVKMTKKIKRWLWADLTGQVTECMYSERENKEDLDDAFPIKLLWSETEFEVE